MSDILIATYTILTPLLFINAALWLIWREMRLRNES
jgi:hypothetical protein